MAQKIDTRIVTKPIAVQLIRADGHNGRGSISLDGIDQLAASIRAVGQLQPIGVIEGEDGEYTLVYGGRRLRAVEKLDQATIMATVYPPGTDAAAMRAVENIQREDPSPIDEAEAVATIAELKAKELGLPEIAESMNLPPEIADAVAGVLGKSAAWVRDRAYLCRLTGKVKNWVADGSLPLGYAREIAKLADPSLRDTVAQHARKHDGEGGEIGHAWSLRDVRRFVEMHLNSLKVVPWKLDTAFAGKPACAECPHNSANSRELFEHDEEKPAESGVCLSESCFAAKQRAAEKAIEGGKAKAVKACRSGCSSTGTSLAEKGLVPKGIKPDTFARQVTKMLPAKDSAKGEKGQAVEKPDAGTAAKKTQMEQARRGDAFSRIGTMIEANARLLVARMEKADIALTRIAAVIDIACSTDHTTPIDRYGAMGHDPCTYDLEADARYAQARARPCPEFEREILGLIVVDLTGADLDGTMRAYEKLIEREWSGKKSGKPLRAHVERALRNVSPLFVVWLDRALVARCELYAEARNTVGEPMRIPPSVSELLAEEDAAAKKKPAETAASGAKEALKGGAKRKKKPRIPRMDTD